MGFWFKVKYNTFVKSLDMLKKVVGIAMEVMDPNDQSQ